MATMALQVHKELLARKVHKALQAQQELMATMVLLDHKVRKVL